jgi:hypothetical protein
MPEEPLKVVELQSQYGRFEIVLDNPHAKRLTILMLGDRHKGFIPPPKMFTEFQEKLDAALAEPGDRVVLSHPFVSALQVDLPEGPVVVTSPAPKRVPAEVVHPVESETYRVGEDDGCIVVSSGESDRAPQVWLSRAMVSWLYARQAPPVPGPNRLVNRDYWYLVEGKRIPIPAEGLRIVEAYDTPVSVFTVTPRRMPADSPFHRGMCGVEAYREALARDQVYVLDVNYIYLHGAS